MSKNVQKQAKKRKATAAAESTSKKPKESLGTELRAYFKTYKNGSGDIHWPIFRKLNRLIKAETVLYPGCHRHITASLIFPHVVYVDNYQKISGCFTDPKVLTWINSNKEYDGEPGIVFKCKNFELPFGEENESFDLVMSMSAGIVTKACAKYVKPSGHVFVSDAHYDARMLFLDPNFLLTHVWDASAERFDGTENGLKGHFTTKDGNRITKSMVQESIDKPKAKRSFKLQKEAMFYLFKKIK